MKVDSQLSLLKNLSSLMGERRRLHLPPPWVIVARMLLPPRLVAVAPSLSAAINVLCRLSRRDVRCLLHDSRFSYFKKGFFRSKGHVHLEGQGGRPLGGGGVEVGVPCPILITSSISGSAPFSVLYPVLHQRYGFL